MIYEQVLGPAHPDTIIIQVNYAVLLLEMNRSDEAVTLLLRARAKRTGEPAE